MRHFITIALAALMASSAVTVHGLPLLGDGAITTQQPLDLNLGQLTQCVTQILGGAETCNLSLLDGLVPGLLKTVGDLLSLDGHVLDLSTLTDLVNQAVASLIKDGKVTDSTDIQVTEVVVIVRGLLVHLPATDAVSNFSKRDLLSEVTSILGGKGLTLADVKTQVQDILVDLNIQPDVDLTRLPLHAEDAVCSLLYDLNLNCKDVLTLLSKQ
ncbi:hypothetical protein BJV82DRAFT_601141 [Fennellomyces sp. T-0311]|nr:hypothetical protein BJV82DRAFT_601141 [Fennellomyces sp. T-0311]